jgi:hypothetical protein
MLFTSGLSIIYCLYSQHEHGPIADYQAIIALQACADVLAELSEKLIDAQPYAYVFKHIKDSLFVDPRRPRRDMGEQSSGQITSENFERPMPQLELADSSNQVNGGAASDPTLPSMTDFNDLGDPDWLLSTWSPSMDRFLTDMGADVNQYAVGDWSLPGVFGTDWSSLL